MLFVCVLHHDVTDWLRFDELGADVPHAPDGCQSLAYFPSRDHLQAVCLWRCDDLATLRGWLDAKTAGLSTNSYFEIDEVHAMGLPKLAAHA
ncbi:MAG: hypothetical protein Q8P41_28595 [Pseudomonadota bacterium]|nr:hypothetical protein [Pseudomonadota bacterium]